MSENLSHSPKSRAISYLRCKYYDGCLSEEQIERLNAIGFNWKKRNRRTPEERVALFVHVQKREVSLERPKKNWLIRSIRKSIENGELTENLLSVLKTHDFPFEKSGGGGKPKPIICYETGAEFPSASAAARWADISYNSIYESVRLGTNAGGYHWYYKSDGKPDSATFRTSKARRVVCIETGEIFESLTAASAVCGVHSCTLANAIATGKALQKHLHFQYAEDAAISAKKHRKKKYRKNRAVLNLETGERFASVSAAATATGFSTGSFYSALNNKARTVGGCHWEYVDTDEKEETD